ncbi:hypothetical protein [Cohnella sp. GCM10027633]|uniref:hypothetical protein n=1 Tax=unclassified Cohnella TaxID=2636738 RepID=UPI00362D5B0A
MEQTAMIRIRAWASKPASLVALSATLFVVANAAYLGLRTLPGLEERSAARASMTAAQERLVQLESRPAPKQPTREQADALLREVPTKHYEADVMLRLGEFADSAGVRLALFKHTEEKAAAEGGLEQQIEQLGGGADGADAEGQAPAPTEGAGTDGLIRADSYEITAIGPLPLVFNFFDLLASNEAVTNITNWSLTEHKDEGIGDVAEFDGRLVYDLTFGFSVYSAPSYEKLFGTTREAESATEESMGRLLERFPEARAFQSIAPSKGETP